MVTAITVQGLTGGVLRDTKRTSIRFKKRTIVHQGVSTMPKVTEAHLEARKEQIVRAAAACFSKTGFHHTTMHDICREADLSPGAVYRYFDSKEDIIAAMMSERRLESVAMIEAIKQERHETLDVLDTLAEVCFSKLENIQSCALDMELWAEAQRNLRIRTMMREDEGALEEAFVKIIAESQARGEINPRLDARAVAQVMDSFFHGLILQKSIDPSIEVWPYVAVIKAMMGGTFWQKENAQKGEGENA
jgi:TetR/AcrR family transcriptional repressor of uid operon